jgi:hypothetical protein
LPENCGQCSDPPGQAGCQDYPQGTAPEERVGNMDISIRALMRQGCPTKTQLRQFPKGFAGFVLSCEISNKNG